MSNIFLKAFPTNAADQWSVSHPCNAWSVLVVSIVPNLCISDNLHSCSVPLDVDYSGPPYSITAWYPIQTIYPLYNMCYS